MQLAALPRAAHPPRRCAVRQAEQRSAGRYARRRRRQWCAPRISWSVTPLMAETTTTTPPRGRIAPARCAAAWRMAEALPTDVPPNFITRGPVSDCWLIALTRYRIGNLPGIAPGCGSGALSSDRPTPPGRGPPPAAPRPGCAAPGSSASPSSGAPRRPRW